MNSIEYGRFEFQRLAFFMIHAVQIRHAYDFSLCFLHELLMSFLSDEYILSVQISTDLTIYKTL